MQTNFLAIGIATIIPLIVGFVWYSPKIGFGKAWMAATGIKEEDGKKVNMALIFGLTIVCSFFIAFTLQTIVIHQFGLYGFLHEQKDFTEPNSLSASLLQQIMDNYSTSFRTFKHGALHGALAGIFLAIPLLAVPALFEMKSFKYVAINGGYWVVSLALMGGVICMMM